MGFIQNMNELYLSLDKLLLLHDSLGTISLTDEQLADIANIQSNLVEILKAPSASENVSIKYAEILIKYDEIFTMVSNANSDFVEIKNIKVTIDSKYDEILLRYTEIVNLSNQVNDKNLEIKNLNPTILQLAQTESPTINYNSTTGELLFGIPKGDTGIKGDKGEAFNVDIFCLDADMSIYDDVPANTSLLVVDTSILYFKISNASADWSSGISFGKGDAGNGIETLDLINTVDNIDTYRFVFTDGGVFDFNIKNSLVTSVSGKSGDIILSKTDVGLNNVDNTSDENKPISNATKVALDTNRLENFLGFNL